MNKILIIGANGQLGQYLVKHFQDNHPDFALVGTTRHKSYDKQPKIYDEAGVEIESLDLTDSISVERSIGKHKPDYIFNTGANSAVWDSWALAQQHLSTNALGVLHILEAIRKLSPESRFLNMGSSEEFAITLENANGAQDETTRLCPRSPYAASKICARNYVDIWRESFGIYAIQPWTYNFESPLRGERFVTRKITKGVARIAKAIKEVKRFEPIELGNINSYRSWQFAGDVADGLWRILNQEKFREDLAGFNIMREAKPSSFWADKIKPYILSENNTHSIKEFIGLAFEKAGISGGIWDGEGINERYTLPEHFCEMAELKSFDLVRINPDFFRPMDVTYLHGDSSKARKELGWEPRIDFSTLVSMMVENDLNNP